MVKYKHDCMHDNDLLYAQKKLPLCFHLVPDIISFEWFCLCFFPRPQDHA